MVSTFREDENLDQRVGIVFPSNYFGEIWEHKESSEVWPWELTLLEEHKTTPFASGVTGSYWEAMQSLHSVVSLWLEAGYTIADQRVRNLREELDEEPPRRRIGFPTVR